ncbi:MAG: FAD-dependent thymidylate synthase [Limnochordia bacterium]|nr:FAD-dependent thymidylate synthase [Limnochordia bacterium]MDD2630172.1 FAD-dependent thymidylate synthase [Limnochordia bacterium]MDD4518264.1 FAD-dependent thymidylate synthase [Limnochordia bacterium]
MFEIKLIERPLLDTAIAALYISKGNEDNIFDDSGQVIIDDKRLAALEKWGFEKGHSQLLKFVTWSWLITGLGRGSYDDLRTHGTFSTFIAKSTRYCKTFQVAPWYAKHYTEDELQRDLTTLKFIQKLDSKPDVVRGHFPLSVDTPFIIKTNLLHFCHIIETRKDHAHPEIILLLGELLDDLARSCNEGTWIAECIEKHVYKPC